MTEPHATSSHTVILYGRDACHLCDDAVAILRRIREEVPFQLLERDITLDDRTHRAYFERIPVIVLDGEELFDYFIDETLLRERLAAPVETDHTGVDAHGLPRVKSGQ